MSVELYRHQQQVARLFGPDANVQAELGTPSRAGTITIFIGPNVLANGSTFAETITQATLAAGTIAKP